MRYVRKGGQLGGVDAVVEPPVEGSFNETCTGFGLEPSTATRTLEARCGATYSNGDSTGQYGPEEANGTWAVSTNIPCTLGGGQVVSLSCWPQISKAPPSNGNSRLRAAADKPAGLGPRPSPHLSRWAQVPVSPSGRGRSASPLDRPRRLRAFAPPRRSRNEPGVSRRPRAAPSAQPRSHSARRCGSRQAQRQRRLVCEPTRTG